MMEEVPRVRSPRIHRSAPASCVERGAYAVQPMAGEPSHMRMPAGGTIQNPRAFSRGNAMSEAPMSFGTK